ncbi:MAG: MgtC/SapB family protein [Vicinamibacterales bacterium]
MGDAILAELQAGAPDLDQIVRAAIRLGVALALGAVAGLPRERTGKAAGLRTHMLVAMGSTLFVLVALEAGLESEIGRVIQGVATGVGFIGGGAILKLGREREIHGLTTAAGLWMTAATGVAAGLGHIALAVIAMTFTWLTLAWIGRFEHHQTDD